MLILGNLILNCVILLKGVKELSRIGEFCEILVRVSLELRDIAVTRNLFKENIKLVI